MRNRIALSVAAASAGVLLAGSASAAVTLTNGSFTTNTGNGQLGFNTTATGWSVAAPPNSYVFLFNGTGANTTADNNGATTGQYGVLSLWGPESPTPTANGLTTSPDGGAFIGADPAFQNGAISTTVTGLTAGHAYAVTFYWAGSQQFGFDGATTEGWRVNFGSGPAQSTPTIPNVNHGFTGWQTSTFTFLADGTSDTLSFLALGTGAAALPPFALLDGVSVTSVPEPATWAFMIFGFGGIGALIRRRRSAAAFA
jgi:hypothetical protein